MLTLPFSSDPQHSFRCSLNGVEYTFDAMWNNRNSTWSFDLSDSATGTIIAAGIPILIGCDLLGNLGLGIGSMFAVDLAATAVNALVDDTLTVAPIVQYTDAGIDDLGVRVIVVYLAPGEVLT